VKRGEPCAVEIARELHGEIRSSIVFKRRRDRRAPNRDFLCTK